MERQAITQLLDNLFSSPQGIYEVLRAAGPQDIGSLQDSFRLDPANPVAPLLMQEIRRIVLKSGGVDVGLVRAVEPCSPVISTAVRTAGLSLAAAIESDESWRHMMDHFVRHCSDLQPSEIGEALHRAAPAPTAASEAEKDSDWPAASTWGLVPGAIDSDGGGSDSLELVDLDAWTDGEEVDSADSAAATSVNPLGDAVAALAAAVPPPPAAAGLDIFHPSQRLADAADRWSQETFDAGVVSALAAVSTALRNPRYSALVAVHGAVGDLLSLLQLLAIWLTCAAKRPSLSAEVALVRTAWPSCLGAVTATVTGSDGDGEQSDYLLCKVQPLSHASWLHALPPLIHILSVLSTVEVAIALDVVTICLLLCGVANAAPPTLPFGDVLAGTEDSAPRDATGSPAFNQLPVEQSQALLSVLVGSIRCLCVPGAPLPLGAADTIIEYLGRTFASPALLTPCLQSGLVFEIPMLLYSRTTRHVLIESIESQLPILLALAASALLRIVTILDVENCSAALAIGVGHLRCLSATALKFTEQAHSSSVECGALLFILGLLMHREGIYAVVGATSRLMSGLQTANAMNVCQPALFSMFLVIPIATSFRHEPSLSILLDAVGLPANPDAHLESYLADLVADVRFTSTAYSVLCNLSANNAIALDGADFFVKLLRAYWSTETPAGGGSRYFS